MTWRLGITHRTGYRYAGPVSSSYNEARITPVSERGQLVLDHRLTVSPTAQMYVYTDYWGTVVTAFDLHVPHVDLEVTATTVLESAGPAERAAPAAGWSDLADVAARDRWVERLAPTPATSATEELLAVAEGLRRLASPGEAAVAAASWVRQRLAYVPGATGVHTTAGDSLAEGKGVCQDFAHVALALLRSLGIPARYVSGYMHPARDAEVGRTVQGESHAWVEWWTGEWLAFDPTNDRVPDEGYAVVARGRDYQDVAPMRGVYTGGQGSALRVSVDVTRLA